MVVQDAHCDHPAELCFCDLRTPGKHELISECLRRATNETRTDQCWWVPIRRQGPVHFAMVISADRLALTSADLRRKH